MLLFLFYLKFPSSRAKGTFRDTYSVVQHGTPSLPYLYVPCISTFSAALHQVDLSWTLPQKPLHHIVSPASYVEHLVIIYNAASTVRFPASCWARWNVSSRKRNLDWILIFVEPGKPGLATQLLPDVTRWRMAIELNLDRYPISRVSLPRAPLKHCVQGRNIYSKRRFFDRHSVCATPLCNYLSRPALPSATSWTTILWCRKHRLSTNASRWNQGHLSDTRRPPPQFISPLPHRYDTPQTCSTVRRTPRDHVKPTQDTLSYSLVFPEIFLLFVSPTLGHVSLPKISQLLIPQQLFRYPLTQETTNYCHLV